MKPEDLLRQLSERSLRVRRLDGSKLEVVGDLSKLSPELKEALIMNRQLFLRLFEEETVGSIGRLSVRFGQADFDFSIWERGERLVSPIAIDTETELIQGTSIPRVALISVSDGREHRLIRPEDLQAFIDLHSQADFVAHNASFDFAVVRKVLKDPLPWVEVAHSGRLHDTMILDALIRLARDDSYPNPRDLGTLSKVYLGVVIDKDDPFRLRYSELLDRSWDSVDVGFFRYAIKDAIATRKLWDVLRRIASDLIKPFEEDLLPGAVDRFGILTESLQVRGAIALSEIERNGVALDRSLVESTRKKLSGEIESLIEQIRKLPETEGLFKYSRSGGLVLTASMKPATNQGRLLEILEAISEELSLEDVPQSEKTKKITSSIKYWGQHSERSLFLSLWVRLEEVAKLFQFFAGLKSERIHPRYTTLVRTGRTSAFRVRSCFDSDGTFGAVRRIVSGKGRSSGEAYGEAFVSRIWDSLRTLNQNPKLRDLIAQRQGGDLLFRELFFSPVVTITGRLRGKVGFSQSRNTPFQGIAADGAKIALWNLFRSGFRVVAFIHDEFLIELPVDSDPTEEASRIDRILCESMERISGSVPISCEYALSDRWYKEAEAVFDDKKKLRLWKPRE